VNNLWESFLPHRNLLKTTELFTGRFQKRRIGSRFPIRKPLRTEARRAAIPPAEWTKTRGPADPEKWNPRPSANHGAGRRLHAHERIFRSQETPWMMRGFRDPDPQIAKPPDGRISRPVERVGRSRAKIGPVVLTANPQGDRQFAGT
jgi:hypothetical protein